VAEDREQRICSTESRVPWHLQAFSAYKRSRGQVGA
jgi:hypothetical protein